MVTRCLRAVAFGHHRIRSIQDDSRQNDIDDFSYTPFVEEGGLGKAVQVFGEQLRPLIYELNEVLAA